MDILVSIAPGVYGPYVSNIKTGQKVLIVECLNAVYGIVERKQITVCFHVDDCKLSHEHPKVIDETVDWLRAEYESIFEDGLGAMKVHRGKVHKYLGMRLDFSHKGKCIVTMHDYLDGILKEFDAAMEKHEHGFLPVTKQRYETPAPDNLFIVNEDCEKLPDEMVADFHTIIAKILYVTKKG